DWWMAGGELAIVDLADGGVTTIAKQTRHAFHLLWSRAGNELFIVTAAGDTAVSSFQLFVVDAEAGATPQLLTPDVPFCVSGMARARDQDELLLIAEVGTETAVHRFHPHSGEYDVLTYVAGDLDALTVSDDG